MPKKFEGNPSSHWEALPRDASFGADGRGMRQVSEIPESPWLVPRTTAFCPDCCRLNEIEGIKATEVVADIHPRTIVDATLSCGHRMKFVGSLAYSGLGSPNGPRQRVKEWK